MEEYFSKNVERYKNETSCSEQQLRPSDVPFVDESRDPQGFKANGSPAEAGDSGVTWNAARDKPKKKRTKKKNGGHCRTRCFEREEPFSDKPTGCRDNRSDRPDLLRCVSNLSTYLTCWSNREDKKLLKMMQYTGSSADVKQVGFIGDSLEKLTLRL